MAEPPTPDEIASGYEGSAQTKISNATVKRELADAMLADPDRHFGRDADARRQAEKLKDEAAILREEAKVEALLALCARVAECSR